MQSYRVVAESDAGCYDFCIERNIKKKGLNELKTSTADSHE
jgi:hypothetical protein